MAPDADIPDSMVTGVSDQSVYVDIRNLPATSFDRILMVLFAVVAVVCALLVFDSAAGSVLWIAGVGVGGLATLATLITLAEELAVHRRKPMYLGVGHGQVPPRDFRRVSELPVQAVPAPLALHGRPSRADRLALVAIKTVEEVLSSKAWRSALVDRAQARLVLSGEIRGLVWRLRELHQTREQLGPAAGGTVFAERHRLLDKAEKSLADRVAALLALRSRFDALSDQLRDLERLETAELLDDDIYRLVAEVAADAQATEELHSLGSQTQAAISAIRGTLSDLLDEMSGIDSATLPSDGPTVRRFLVESMLEALVCRLLGDAKRAADLGP